MEDVKLEWTGPFKIKELLKNCINENVPWPPNNHGAYLVSKESWNRAPDAKCVPLYCGGISGKSNRFRTRIGDLLADMHNFFGDDTGHHSGGQVLFEWCKSNGIHPGDLYIAWASRTDGCNRCVEIDVIQHLLKGAGKKWAEREDIGLLNSKRPPRCGERTID